MVDVVGDLRIQVTQRVVGKGGQMDDRLESLQVPPLNVPEVDSELRHRLNPWRERAFLKQVAVETHHVVTGAQQPGHHGRADVAFVSGN